MDLVSRTTRILLLFSQGRDYDGMRQSMTQLLRRLVPRCYWQQARGEVHTHLWWQRSADVADVKDATLIVDELRVKLVKLRRVTF